MIEITRTGPVFVLTMCAGDNRFNRSFTDRLSHALDEIESTNDSVALVTTGGEEKFYSNGLDLEWMMGEGQSDAKALVGDVMRLFARMLAFPIPSVAAINGHAFAAGAMFAIAQDFRVMREDRGFLCLPEVDLGMPLAPGMNALLQAKLGTRVLHELLLTGKRIGAGEAVASGIVDEVCSRDLVVDKAIQRAAALAGKPRDAYSALKRGLYGPAIAVLNEAALP